MTLRNGFPAVSDAADQFDIRAALRANIAQDADGNIKQGLAPTAATLAGVVSSRDDMQCDIVAFSAAIDRQGPVFLHHDGTDQVTITPAPAANSRIDSIWVKQQESAAPLSDSTDGPVFGVTDGTPNANPVPPEIPEGALQLATITIPSTATSTSSSGVIITNTYPFTASLGGQIYFRSDTEMQEWPPVEGQKAFIPTGDKAGEYVGKAGVWDSVSETETLTLKPEALNGSIVVNRKGCMVSAFFNLSYSSDWKDAQGSTRYLVNANKIPLPIGSTDTVVSISTGGNWNSICVVTVNANGSVSLVPRGGDLLVKKGETARFSILYMSA